MTTSRSIPSRWRISGLTLFELLAVVVVLSVLMAMLLPSVIRGYHHAREWIFGVYIWHNSKLEVFLRDESSPAVLQRWATFGAEPWVIQKSNKVETTSYGP